MGDKKPKTDKFLRCEAACVAHLKGKYPRYVGHRAVAIVLADGGYDKRETFCDEMVRQALNALVSDGRVSCKTVRTRGIAMKVFGYSEL